MSTIQGVCNETLTIHRDDVILMGAEPGGGLAVPTTSSYPLGVAGGQRVELPQLTLQGGGYGLLSLDPSVWLRLRLDNSAA